MLSKITFILVLTLFVEPAPAWAAMSSTQYYIYSDSIGVDGGAYSTSTSYTLNDTIGESAVGTQASVSYELRGGFQNADQGLVSITVSNNSIDLGALSTNVVSSASTDVVVTSEAASGYVLSVTDVSGTSVQPVQDGSVTAGGDEYGVSVAGSNRAYTDDRGIQNGLVLASSNFPINSDTSTLTFKASVSNGTSVHSYSQTFSVLVTAN